MFVLGINAYHADSAACLLRDGELVAAAEEERFRRVKHWAGLPTLAIRYCLDEAKIQADDLDHIAVNRSPGANPWRRALFLLRHRPAIRLVGARLSNLRATHSLAESLRKALREELPHTRIHYVEHHGAHLASAYFGSPFEEAVAVSVDGCGDFVSTAWGPARREQMRIDRRIYFPHSLGIFYSAVTQFLGFNSFGDEYKVMGLAAYGRPHYVEALRQVLRLQSNGRFRLDLRYFRHHLENVSYRWNGCGPEIGVLFTTRLEQLLGPIRQKHEPLDPRHKDLAASAQALYEEALFALLNAAHREYRSPNLALAGGCALNSVANGKIALYTPFKNIYVPPAAGDAGGAIGAALACWHKLTRAAASRRGLRPFASERKPRAPRSGAIFTVPAPRLSAFRHAYAGPQFNDHAIASLLARRGFHIHFDKEQTPVSATNDLKPPQAYHFPDPSVLCIRTARAIAEGKVVGWFQGRMEWGPRALGNRSILCDPRRTDMKRILNEKIKRRESFRPFAPSILGEHTAEWFEQQEEVPFMTSVFKVRPEKRALIPAVTHVDGSARLQTVSETTNALFHQLITSFHAITAVPMVLNTSFNEQEPIVCQPQEALACFLRTEMDVLVLGGFFISRRNEAN